MLYWFGVWTDSDPAILPPVFSRTAGCLRAKRHWDHQPLGCEAAPRSAVTSAGNRGIQRSPNIAKGRKDLPLFVVFVVLWPAVRSCDRIGVCLEAAAAAGTGGGSGCRDLLGDLRREAHEVLGIGVLIWKHLHLHTYKCHWMPNTYIHI